MFINSALTATLVSTCVVALAEIGDKTQLLAFVLAAKFRKPLPIITAIFLATVINHGLAGAIGVWLTNLIPADWMRWILGISFLAMAAWTLIPDKLDNDHTKLAHFSVFATTFIAFFLAEMGDKTQIATVALAARYDHYLAVVLGTTLGMLIANAPAVLLGERLAHRLPTRLVHIIAAAIFALLGVATLVSGLFL
jgi:putative Ca2+/H+ antiporter (TMEM165/GDT1 family)